MKLAVLGFILMGLGFASGVAEGFFYGGKLDDNNVVQESFLLPLSFLLAFAGSILVVLSIAITTFRKMKKK